MCFLISENGPVCTTDQPSARGSFIYGGPGAFRKSFINNGHAQMTHQERESVFAFGKICGKKFRKQKRKTKNQKSKVI